MLPMSFFFSPIACHSEALLRRLGWVSLFAVLGPLLTGCDQLGIDTPQKAAERQVADAKAVGSACRHALRAIEDCYTLNPKADKASVFAGWREMDEYMRENKLEGVAPVVPRPALAASKPAPKKPVDDEDEADAEDGPKAGKAGKGKALGH